MLTFVPTPLGNLRDITLRALDIFESSSLILCEDTRVTRRLLNLLRERELLQKSETELLSFNEHNGPERLRRIGSRLERERVAYVSDAGMPGISDPGQLLAEYCREHGISYDVLPGPSAVTTAYAASGFPDGRFLFYGFLPREGRVRREALESLMREAYDAVLYEAPHRLRKLLQAVEEIDPEREIFLAKEISKQHQRYERGSVASLRKRIDEEETVRGEWVVILRGKTGEHKALYAEDILALDLPPKIRAKLLARLTGESTKEWYDRLREGR